MKSLILLALFLITGPIIVWSAVSNSRLQLTNNMPAEIVYEIDIKDPLSETPFPDRFFTSTYLPVPAGFELLTYWTCVMGKWVYHPETMIMYDPNFSLRTKYDGIWAP
jgi:hypothetical protein